MSVCAALLALNHATAALAPAEPVEQIVVTARRIEEPLASLPLAVTVIDPQDLGRLGLTTLDQLARAVPGFSFHSAAGRGPNSNRPAIRGLTTIQNGVANTSAATTFIDGVYLGGSSQSTPLHDVERIEVLRGPQSAQFGRGTYAGAINYVTRSPGDSVTAGAEATVAEHATRRVSGWFGGPVLPGKLGALLSVGVDHYGGEYRNTRDGSRIGGESSADASLKVVAQPVDALELTLRFAAQRTDDEHFAVWLQPRTANNCCLRSASSPRAREYFDGKALRGDDVTLYTDALAVAGGAGFALDRELATLRATLALPGNWSLWSLSGVVSDEIERGFDASYAAYDPVPAQPGSFLVRDKLAQADLSQELRVSSPRDADWRGTLGGYYYRGRLDEDWKRNVRVAPDGSVTVVDSPAALVQQDIRNRALFGALEADLGAAWIVGMELRYAADEVRIEGTRVDERSFRSLSPRLTASWRRSDHLMVYANVARGTSPGTFNAVVPDERYRAVDEEVIWNYELGLRATSRTGRDRLTLAAYRIDGRDQQATSVVELPDGTTTSLLDNVGATRVHGLEVEASSRLTEALDLRLAWGWTDAEIRERLSEEVADLNGGNGTTEALRMLGNVAGNRVPRVPRHQGVLGFEYHGPLGVSGEWAAGADWSYEGSRLAQEDNLIETGSSGQLSASLRLSWADWEVSLWGTNLGDDDAPVDVQRYFDRRSGVLQSCAGFVSAGTAPPGTLCAGSSASPRGFAISLPRGRQVGATVRYRFH